MNLTIRFKIALKTFAACLLLYALFRHQKMSDRSRLQKINERLQYLVFTKILFK